MEVVNIQNARSRAEDMLYLVSRIILPIAVMIVFAVFIAERVEIINTVVFSFIKVNVEGVEALTYKAIKCCIVLFITWGIYRKFIKEKKRPFAENKRGDYPLLFYRIAECLGYERVSLVHKSVPLQFSILNSRIFKDYQTGESDIEVIEVNCISYKKEAIEGDSKAINIGVFDTYDGNKSMIPKSLQANKTVLLRPEKKDNDAKRFYSDVLINSLNRILSENTKTKTFNLLLFTNPFTNKKIYENVFNTKTDNYTVRVHFYDYHKKVFKDNYIEIKP